MREMVQGWRHAGRRRAAVAGLATVLIAALSLSLWAPPRSEAGWPWKRKRPQCGHHGCTRDHCYQAEGWAGQWYWVRSPDQEQRVVMALYNRYCIRCHGVDGRGVWDIPDVPDFTDPRWQKSRVDPQIVNIVMEGRGAVMPMFRGTLSLDEAWAMARYLRTFVPGTEVTRPDVGRSGASAATGGENAMKPEIPAPVPVAGRIINPAS